MMPNTNIFCGLLLEDYLTDLKVTRRDFGTEGLLSLEKVLSSIDACWSLMEIYEDLDLCYAQTLVVASLCLSVAEGMEVSRSFNLGNPSAWDEIKQWICSKDICDAQVKSSTKSMHKNKKHLKHESVRSQNEYESGSISKTETSHRSKAAYKTHKHHHTVDRALIKRKELQSWEGSPKLHTVAPLRIKTSKSRMQPQLHAVETSTPIPL